MRGPRRIWQRRGLSLIELLVALLIFATVALSLYSVFAQGLRLQKKAKAEEEQYRALRWALEVLTQDLSHAGEFTVLLPQEEVPRGAIWGEKDTVHVLRFTSAGLEVIRYGLKAPEEEWVYQTVVGQRSSGNVPIIVSYSETEDQLQYLVRERTLLAPGQGGGETETEILYRRVIPGGLEFTYGGVSTSAGEESLEWFDHWDEEGLPAMIKITCSGNDAVSGQERTWTKDVLIPAGAW